MKNLEMLEEYVKLENELINFREKIEANIEKSINDKFDIFIAVSIDDNYKNVFKDYIHIYSVDKNEYDINFYIYKDKRTTSYCTHKSGCKLYDFIYNLIFKA